MSYASSPQPRAAPAAYYERLSDAELESHLDYLAGAERVPRLGYRVSERRQYPEKFPDRNAAICARFERGETQGMLALDYGVSPSAISKIIQRARKKCRESQAASRLFPAYRKRRRTAA